MTLKELSQLYYLNREIEMDQRRLEELRSKVESPPAPGLSGMPGVVTAERVDLEAVIKAKQEQCIHERNRLERFIGDIDDSLDRQIFILRFVNGLSWAEVAASIGGGNTGEGVRRRFYRQLKKNEGDLRTAAINAGLPYNPEEKPDVDSSIYK